jgi:HD domain
MPLSPFDPECRQGGSRVDGTHVLNRGDHGVSATPLGASGDPSVVTMQRAPDVPELIDTHIAQAAMGLARSTESPAVFNHSVRSYLFGELLAARDGLRPGADYDSETLFLACVLHDLGVGTAATGKARFEVEGADLAAALLTEHGCERAVVDGVWEAIALHSSFGIAERRGPLCYLTRLGIGVDFRPRCRVHRRKDRRGDSCPLAAASHDELADGRNRGPRATQPRSGAAVFAARNCAARAAIRRHHAAGAGGNARPVGRLIEPGEKQAMRQAEDACCP